MPTKTETAFLNHQKIPLHLTFNVKGLSKKEYQKQMRKIGAVIAIGATPCKAYGHTIRTRAGHCAQCDTSRIAYMLRNDNPAYIYVGYSASCQLHKIGSSTSPLSRMKTLNGLGYANTSDWKLIHKVKVNRAGEKELIIHQLLGSYRYEISYNRDGEHVNCREIFNASLDLIMDTVNYICRIG